LSDNYDPLSTQTSLLSFRRLDALQDTVTAFGKNAAGSPVAVLVANDGVLQTRRLNRLTDEILLIGTDQNAVARPVLVDAQGRLYQRILSAFPVLDFDSVRAYFRGPSASQVQGKADADGTLNVSDPIARATLAEVLSRLDVSQSALRDAIVGPPPNGKSLLELGQDLVGAIEAAQPRSITNFPLDFPDAGSQIGLQAILGQLDVPLSSHGDAVVSAIAANQARHVTNFPLDFPDQLAHARLQSLLAQADRSVSEVYDVRSAHGAVTAAQNTSGLTVTLDLGPTGRPTVQRFVSQGGTSTVQVQASRDGATWRTLETLTTTLSPTSSLAAVQGFGYRFVRATSASTGVALEFEISASR